MQHRSDLKVNVKSLSLARIFLFTNSLQSMKIFQMSSGFESWNDWTETFLWGPFIPSVCLQINPWPSRNNIVCTDYVLKSLSFLITSRNSCFACLTWDSTVKDSYDHLSANHVRVLENPVTCVEKWNKRSSLALCNVIEFKYYKNNSVALV